MGSGHGAHEKDDRHHHEARCGDGGAAADRAVALRVDHRRARGGEHEEERAESFGEQSPPLTLGSSNSARDPNSRAYQAVACSTLC
jgi:hypothetical protein